MAQRVERTQVVAYRIAEQGLHRRAKSMRQLDVLQLGVQNTPPGSAKLACAVRLATLPEDVADLRFAWTYRISPHLHHGAELPGIAAALWPPSEAEAIARLNWPSARLAATGRTALAVIEQATNAMAEVVTAPMTKGAVSAAVTELVDPALSNVCKACKSRHVYESLFRLAALPAGVCLDTESSPMLLTPIEDWPGRPARSAGLADLVRTYLRLLGPATIADVADFFSANKKELAAHWPDDLVEVDVDGRVGWFPHDRLEALRTPPEPPRLRLLPPGDPFLQSRDRMIIVPDVKAHKELWRILGNPGALLVDGEVIAAYRTKAVRKRRLELAFQYFQPLPVDLRDELDAEAERLARVRGFAEFALG